MSGQELRRVGGSWLAFDGMTWPNPADPTEVEWRLRYTFPTRDLAVTAASFVHAYRALVFMPERNAIIRRLREGAELSRAEGGEA